MIDAEKVGKDIVTSSGIDANLSNALQVLKKYFKG